MEYTKSKVIGLPQWYGSKRSQTAKKGWVRRVGKAFFGNYCLKHDQMRKPYGYNNDMRCPKCYDESMKEVTL